ncbi:protein NRT1/ PTR FAMILY 8.3-like [Canna indica]|uniref:Protein NRT1/ PTR FAMILY 8.3-like n=1 Tax=Canna indica TaxID=4628 RepID=A0AAQ3QKV8_9LILI|nr:protein NRT1/ PTR FAMILY 8.3-like [Canna indica]
MEREDVLESGEGRPLLPLSGTSSHSENELSHHGSRSHHKPSHSKAPAIILGFEYLDSVAFNGVGANLIVYLFTVLHGNNASNAANVATWSGTCFLTPLFGAIVADTYWGNYKTILISLVVYLLGMITITSSAFSASSKLYQCEGGACQSASTLLFCGLYLVAIGSGGVKAALLPFGAEQFDDENPSDREKKGAFFGWFYLCITLGALTSMTFIVWIQENISWGLGYSIATFCMAAALAAFVLGTPYYRRRLPSGSPLQSILQVLVASYKKRNAENPRDISLLYEVNKESSDLVQQKLPHTNGFRFLDKAATISALDLKDGSPQSSWSLCTVTQVEELKMFLRLIPIWANSIVYAAVFAQMFTTFIQQGSAMNAKIGSFSIPPASLCSFEIISVMGLVFVYNNIISPAAKKYLGNGTGFSQLQRMGIGRFLLILAMLTASYNENRRLESAKAGETLNIMWQLPQFFVLASSEVFNNITQLEFFFAQAPDRMKSICTAMVLFSMSLGNYLNSFIITFIATVTSGEGRPGWISDDLNKGHLDYYFLVLAVISIGNFFVYLSFAKNYTLKKVTSES